MVPSSIVQYHWSGKLHQQSLYGSVYSPGHSLSFCNTHCCLVYSSAKVRCITLVQQNQNLTIAAGAGSGVAGYTHSCVFSFSKRRSEERRVGKECRSGWAPTPYKEE